MYIKSFLSNIIVFLGLNIVYIMKYMCKYSFFFVYLFEDLFIYYFEYCPYLLLIFFRTFCDKIVFLHYF